MVVTTIVQLNEDALAVCAMHCRLGFYAICGLGFV
jgi:hypothetical protein